MTDERRQAAQSAIRHVLASLLLMACDCRATDTLAAEPVTIAEARPPANEQELHTWLENMARYHRFSVAEMRAATGLDETELRAALERFGLAGDDLQRPPGVRLLPYPGGRHPRLGFLDGAVRPQRETKASLFVPWDLESYVVIDVPEAIWSNLGLTYLAHTHVRTIWEKQDIELERLEWQQDEDGNLSLRRRLPNGIEFASELTLVGETLEMRMSLTNGTSETLTGLRVQNCVMLGYCEGFAEQTNDNKIFRDPYAACRNEAGDRWIITAWQPIHRAWGNERCPCLHSDPVFDDCPPGETRHISGRVWFYQGTNIEQELDRLEATGWSESSSMAR